MKQRTVLSSQTVRAKGNPPLVKVRKFTMQTNPKHREEEPQNTCTVTRHGDCEQSKQQDLFSTLR